MGINYVCPGCQNAIWLRRRHVLSKRECPTCRQPITTAEIDRQRLEAIRDQAAFDRQQDAIARQNAAVAGRIGLVTLSIFGALGLAMFGSCFLCCGAGLFSNKERQVAKVTTPIQFDHVSLPKKANSPPRMIERQTPIIPSTSTNPTTYHPKTPPSSTSLGTTSPTMPTPIAPTIPEQTAVTPAPVVKDIVRVDVKPGTFVIMADNRISYDAYMAVGAKPEVREQLEMIGRIKLLREETVAERLREADDFTYLVINGGTPKAKTWLVKSQFVQDK